MRHRVYFHVVWTTRNRLPLIDAPRAAFLAEFLPRLATHERAQVRHLGMVSTHVHALIRAHPACSVPRLVMRWKSLSALLTRRQEIGAEDRPLRWAGGYSLTTVSPGHLAAVRRYLDDQPHHHPLEAITPGIDLAVSAASAAPCRAQA
jgi:putative transposase